MQTYEIYRVPPCSCDSEWQRLGEVQADSLAYLVEQAMQRWEISPPGLLVALTVNDIPMIIVPVDHPM